MAGQVIPPLVARSEDSSNGSFDPEPVVVDHPEDLARARKNAYDIGRMKAPAPLAQASGAPSCVASRLSIACWASPATSAGSFPVSWQA